MTKVNIIGQEPKKDERKKIEFVYLLNENLVIESTSQTLHPVKEIILLQKNYGKGLDLMFAMYDDSDCNCIFLGHFNDGIV